LQNEEIRGIKSTRERKRISERTTRRKNFHNILRGGERKWLTTLSGEVGHQIELGNPGEAKRKSPKIKIQ